MLDVEDDRARYRVQKIARGNVAVRVPHHLERKRHVKQAQASGGIEFINARRSCRALFQQRALRRMLDARCCVVADLRDGVGEFLGTKGEEIGRNNMVGNGRSGLGGQAFGHDLAEHHLASIGVVPKRFDHGGRNDIHGEGLTAGVKVVVGTLSMATEAGESRRRCLSTPSEPHFGDAEGFRTGSRSWI
jgi:hypothetical protein